MESKKTKTKLFFSPMLPLSDNIKKKIAFLEVQLLLLFILLSSIFLSIYSIYPST